MESARQNHTYELIGNDKRTEIDAQIIEFPVKYAEVVVGEAAEEAGLYGVVKKVGILVQKYKDHPQVVEADNKLRNGNLITAGVNEDELTVYAQVINQYDIMTPADEKVTFANIKSGMGLLDEVGYNEPTEKQEESLIDLVINWQKAYHCNLKLVYSLISLRYKHIKDQNLDLMQEGALALSKAIAGFDPDKGFKFSSYAQPSIIREVFKANSAQMGSMRLPVDVHKDWLDFRNASEFLMSDLQREPTNQEVADFLDKTTDEVEELILLKSGVIPLDKPLGDGPDDAVIGDLVPDETTTDTEGKTEALVEKLHLEKLIEESPLDTQEKLALSVSYGLVVNSLVGTVVKVGTDEVAYDELMGDSPDSHDANEASQKLGVSPNMVRQAESKALRVLKAAASPNSKNRWE